MPNAETPRWERSNGSFAVQWGESLWILNHSDGRIGPRPASGSNHRLLELEGLAAVGRREEDLFASDALDGLELLHNRVYATFTPKGWRGLTIRAAWGPTREGGGLDLEIQAVTSTVGELEKLEVLVGSTWSANVVEAPRVTVEPRDRRSASLSYDGRENAESLRRLTTLPVAGAELSTFAPITASVEGAGRYLEMAHPHDVSRRRAERIGGETTAARYALFGFDLEKGVVLRGRLRGVWLDDSDSPEEHLQRFLSEPPPLGVV